MESIIQHAQETIQHAQERISSYISPILRAIVKTYFIPVLGIFLARIAMYIANDAVIGGLFIGMPGAVLSIIIFLAILYYGLRFSEQRWHGTALLIAYSAVSKARRILESLLAAENPEPLYIKQGTENYNECVDRLMQAVHDYGLQPKVK